VLLLLLCGCLPMVEQVLGMPKALVNQKLCKVAFLGAARAGRAFAMKCLYGTAATNAWLLVNLLHHLTM
jgi:hypothetical protein